MKASETPIPRGSTTNKKRRVSEGDSGSVNRKMKESVAGRRMMNGDVFGQDLLQTRLHTRQSVELPDAMLYSPQKEPSSETSIPIDPALQSYDDKVSKAFATPPSASHRDTVLTSIENPADDLMEDVLRTESHEYLGHAPEPHTPGPPPHVDVQRNPNGANTIPSSPLSPLAPSLSSVSSRTALRAALPSQPSSSRVGSHVGKASQTPRPTNKTTTTKYTPSGKRQDSKETIKLEYGARNTSIDVEKPEDVASLALAIQLQMEEHGLRRRSR